VLEFKSVAARCSDYSKLGQAILGATRTIIRSDRHLILAVPVELEHVRQDRIGFGYLAADVRLDALKE
jgi:hypothetical protein